ncbi:MAG: hypothetical protein Q4C03_06100, partial [bacterium]|nr:hypothetical protein [bacterium]
NSTGFSLSKTKRTLAGLTLLRRFVIGAALTIAQLSKVIVATNSTTNFLKIFISSTSTFREYPSKLHKGTIQKNSPFKFHQIKI